MSVLIDSNRFIPINKTTDADSGKKEGINKKIVKAHNNIDSFNSKYCKKNVAEKTETSNYSNPINVRPKVNASRPINNGLSPATAGASPRGIKNNAAPEVIKPPHYSAAAGSKDEQRKLNDLMDNYIKETILPEVNLYGKPPLWLRPIAAVATWFGYHGVGQTNCLSCAAAVADTLKQGIMHRAIPTLRGGRFDQFATLAPLGRDMFDSVEKLADKLNKLDELAAKRQKSEALADKPEKNGDINAVLNVNRPFWRRLFSPVSGHASNIIKIGNTIRLVDAQKKNYETIVLNGDVLKHLRDNPSIPLDKELLTLQENDRIKIVEALKDFIGPVASSVGAITISDVGFKQ